MFKDAGKVVLQGKMDSFKSVFLKWSKCPIKEITEEQDEGGRNRSRKQECNRGSSKLFPLKRWQVYPGGKTTTTTNRTDKP